MKKKISILALAILGSGLLSLYVSGQATPKAKQQQDIGVAIQGLSDRITALEMQVAALQNQIKALESRSANRILTIPDSRYFHGGQMPPGATPHDYKGIKYWTVPLGADR